MASDGLNDLPQDVFSLVNGDVGALFADASTLVDDVNRTPMRCAVQAGHLDVVEVLIENGADLRRRPTGRATSATKIDLSYGEVTPRHLP